MRQAGLCTADTAAELGVARCQVGRVVTVVKRGYVQSPCEGREG
jgi:hypothetical protein